MENFIVFNYINEYIEFIIVLFIFSLYGIVFKANNFIKLLIYIEIIILIINFNFIFFSFIIDDIIGQIFSIFILAIIASESAIRSEERRVGIEAIYNYVDYHGDK